MPRPRKKPEATKAVAVRDPADDRSSLPWERQKGESAKAFWAFQVYRDLGPTRSLAKVGEIAGETGVASPSMMERWSSRWGWVDRAHAFDLDEDRKRRADNDRARADAGRTRAMAGTLMVGLALRRLRGDERGETPVAALDPNELSAYDVVALAREGSRLQAEALGDGMGLASLEPGLRDAVRTLARDLLAVAVARIEEAARQAAEIGADVDLEAMIAGHVEAMIDEARVVFAKAHGR
jgi:hypothetical protein